MIDVEARATAAIGYAIDHHMARINGIDLHYVTAGEGPTIVLVHGFPEFWYGWRHQIAPLAAAGFRVVVPDMRGFGRSEAPAAPEAYTSLHAVGDLVGLLDHLGVADAGIAGHDWGATIAWTAPLLRPDRFVAVAGLAVPLTPRGEHSLIAMLRAGAPRGFYMLHFQEPGVAERELDAAPEAFLRRIFSGTGHYDKTQPMMMAGDDGLLIPNMPLPDDGVMPGMTEDELAFYVDEYGRTGFRGALNTYRSLHPSWELTAAWADARIEVPALYIGGEDDIVLTFPGMREAIANFSHLAPACRPPVMIPDSGHFVQHEASGAVNTALIEFFTSAMDTRS